MAHAPAWDDLTAFVDTDDFAVTATHTPATGQPRQVRGVFDDSHLDASLGEYDADTTDPRFAGIASELDGIKRGDSLQIAGQDYAVLKPPQPDGTGMATVRLAAQ